MTRPARTTPNTPTPTATTAPPETFRVEGGRLELDGVSIGFHRTLRVSEGGPNWLPPSLGLFPLRPLAPVADRVPDAVRARGGVLLPLYVREAMWISFDTDEPVAVQIGTGGICVVSGRALTGELSQAPQNYVVTSRQPWIDGFKTASGEVRQFVGVPAGSGLSVEHQLTGADATGGIQIQVWRLTPDALARWRSRRTSSRLDMDVQSGLVFCELACSPFESQAIGAGGRITQEIFSDDFEESDWQTTPAARCWVHLVSAAQWRAVTGEVPPPTPVSVDDYVQAGLPWFDFYDADAADLPTSDELAGIRSVGDLLGETDSPTVHPDGVPVVRYGDRRPNPVDPGTWSFPL